MNMKQHHFQSDESCHFPLLCKGNTTSAHPAAISHCQEWRPKKPLCCTHKCNWIPEKPAQLISTLRSFNTLLLNVQPGVCRNWCFLGLNHPWIFQFNLLSLLDSKAYTFNIYVTK